MRREVQISHYSHLRSLTGISPLTGGVGDTKQEQPKPEYLRHALFTRSSRRDRLKETIFESTRREEGDTQYLPVTK